MDKLLFLLACIVSAEEILVLLDSSELKTTHSEYFNKITSRGHNLTYKMSDSMGIKLEKYDEYFYSTIILMCPSAEGNK